MDAVTRRSTRDRPSKAPLSEVAVVDAALTVLAAEGLSAVSMRRVATALDTGAASLYVYVANRDALLRAMQGRILALVDLERPRPAQWRAQVHRLLGRVHDVLVAHPGIAATTAAVPPTSEAALLLQENLLGLLTAGGLGPADVVAAADVLAGLATYRAIETDARAADRNRQAAGLREVFAGLPPERFPLITALVDRLVAGDSDERFAIAVDAVLDGLLARSTTRRPRAVTRTR